MSRLAFDGLIGEFGQRKKSLEICLPVSLTFQFINFSFLLSKNLVDEADRWSITLTEFVIQLKLTMCLNILRILLGNLSIKKKRHGPNLEKLIFLRLLYLKEWEEKYGYLINGRRVLSSWAYISQKQYSIYN